MVKEFPVVAAGLLKGLRQFWHSLEGAALVNLLCKLDDLRASPGGLNSGRSPKGVAEDVAQQIRLRGTLAEPGTIEVSGLLTHRQHLGGCLEGIRTTRGFCSQGGNANERLRNAQSKEGLARPGR